LLAVTAIFLFILLMVTIYPSSVGCKSLPLQKLLALVSRIRTRHVEETLRAALPAELGEQLREGAGAELECTLAPPLQHDVFEALNERRPVLLERRRM
jgi:hypothetical protein